MYCTDLAEGVERVHGEVQPLYCTALYCTELYCTVLYCTVLYCTVLYYTVLYCAADLTTQGKVELTPSLTLWVSVIVLLLSPASFLSSVAGRTSVEKDWIVIMCEGDTAKLARVNTNLRTIDHFCNLLAPLLAGQILTFSSYFAAALILMVWVRFAD